MGHTVQDDLNSGFTMEIPFIVRDRVRFFVKYAV